MKTIVWAATRSDGTVGYFATLAEVPSEFKHLGQEDIEGIMRSFRTSDIEYCLSQMNSHWKNPGTK